MPNLNIHLLVIDGQNSFMGNADGSPYQVGTEVAALPVKGGVEDMKRCAALIDRVGQKLADIHVTLDSHRVIDVGHAGMWRNEAGEQPAPFTIISSDDIKNRIWYPRHPAYMKRLYDYAVTLEAGGKYAIMVWPEHCKIGTWGHCVQADLAAALERWERKEIANVDYVVKGTNAFTEHYGALQAEVPDSRDPSTQLNTHFLYILQSADIIAVAGEASSHCVKATVEQIASNIGTEHVKKFHLLTDCMSPVEHPVVDFPKMAATFMKDMEALGMTLTTSDRFLA